MERVRSLLPVATTGSFGKKGLSRHFSDSSNPEKKCRGGKHNHDMSDTIIIWMALHRECGKYGSFEKVRVGDFFQ